MPKFSFCKETGPILAFVGDAAADKTHPLAEVDDDRAQSQIR